MFGSGAIRNLPRIASYAEAEEHWRDTPVTRSAKWDWAKERPLYNTRATHYALRKGDGFYDVRLYRTTMLRLYPPGTDGSELRHYAYDSRIASREFLWQVCDFSLTSHEVLFGTENVYVPVSQRDHHDWTAPNGVCIPSGFFAALTLVDGRIDLLCSAHRPCYKKASNEADIWSQE